jgi:hypothetical protein
MKKYILLTMMVLTLMIPHMAWCQTGPGGMNGSPQGVGTPGGGQMGDGQHFQERKAEILKHISEHLTEIQQRQSCVESANDRQALMACMPHRDGDHSPR